MAGESRKSFLNSATPESSPVRLTPESSPVRLSSESSPLRGYSSPIHHTPKPSPSSSVTSRVTYIQSSPVRESSPEYLWESSSDDGAPPAKRFHSLSESTDNKIPERIVEQSNETLTQEERNAHSDVKDETIHEVCHQISSHEDHSEMGVLSADCNATATKSESNIIDNEGPDVNLTLLGDRFRPAEGDVENETIHEVCHQISSHEDHSEMGVVSADCNATATKSESNIIDNEGPDVNLTLLGDRFRPAEGDVENETIHEVCHQISSHEGHSEMGVLSADCNATATKSESNIIDNEGPDMNCTPFGDGFRLAEGDVENETIHEVCHQISSHEDHSEMGVLYAADNATATESESNIIDNEGPDVNRTPFGDGFRLAEGDVENETIHEVCHQISSHEGHSEMGFLYAADNATATESESNIIDNEGPDVNRTPFGDGFRLAEGDVEDETIHEVCHQISSHEGHSEMGFLYAADNATATESESNIIDNEGPDVNRTPFGDGFRLAEGDVEDETIHEVCHQISSHEGHSEMGVLYAADNATATESESNIIDNEGPDVNRTPFGDGFRLAEGDVEDETIHEVCHQISSHEGHSEMGFLYAADNATATESESNIIDNEGPDVNRTLFGDGFRSPDGGSDLMTRRFSISSSSSSFSSSSFSSSSSSSSCCSTAKDRESDETHTDLESSLDSSSDNEDLCFSLGDRQVYNGHDLTIDEGVLSIMDLYVSNKLPKGVMSGMLQALLRFLPKDNLMPKSQHMLFKYITDLCPPVPENVHFYCKTCLYYIGLVCESCPICQCSETKKFYQLSIKKQLENLFENHNLADIIDKYAEERMANPEGTISDITDGSEYRRARLPGRYDLTLLGHTDGVSISESSNESLWPLEFFIIEIPPRLRYKFVLICGIWVDSSHPNMHCYLKPVVSELTDLYESGFTWTNPKSQAKETSRVIAPVFCADAPVRAQIQNILSHGGKYCCHVCEQKTVRLPAEEVVLGVKQKKRKRVFTFKEVPSTLRSKERMEAQILETRESQRLTNQWVAKKGVKGESVVSQLPQCDQSTVVYPEYMHILLGIIKQFMGMWFESDEKMPYSLKKYRDDINNFLLSIRVPDFLTRIPRSTELYSKWKANELRSFLLYFSLIVLSLFFKEEYMQHWMLFVNGVFILLKETVTECELEKVQIMFRMFLRDFNQLYDPKEFSYNLHNILHFCLIVKRWGPLWANSAFGWENFNGLLSQCIHGSRNQGKELVGTIQLHQGVQILKARCESKSKVNQAKHELLNKVKTFKINTQHKEILNSLNCRMQNIYFRASVKGVIYTSNIYKRQEARNNYTVCFRNSRGVKSYGEVNCFVEVICVNDTSPKNCCFVDCFQIEHLRMFTHCESGVVVKHIIPIKESCVKELIPLEDIKYKVIRVGGFVCERPNTFEVNL